jgi:phage host-nuclease inhibitor protein Gam
MNKRLKAPQLKSREDFTAAVDEAARLTVEIREIEAERDSKLQTVQSIFGEQIQPLQVRCNALVAEAERYAEEHREELLPGKLKSDATPLATLGFRTGMPQLKTLPKWTWEKVLAALGLNPRLSGYIRSKPEVDKAAIIANTKDGTLSYQTEVSEGEVQISYLGLRVVQEETFFIEPKLDDASQVKAGAQ